MTGTCSIHVLFIGFWAISTHIRPWKQQWESVRPHYKPASQLPDQTMAQLWFNAVPALVPLGRHWIAIGSVSTDRCMQARGTWTYLYSFIVIATPLNNVHPADRKGWTDIQSKIWCQQTLDVEPGLMFGHRLPRWLNIKPTWFPRLLFVGMRWFQRI